jgi:transcriptional regulator
MYNLPYFKEQDPARIMAFMHEHPFVTLCGVDAAQRPVITQVPVLVTEQEGTIRIRGHIMKQTDHHLAFIHNNQVLAVFTSPNTYVSASWYTNKQQGSTWNYQSVHARGTLSFLPEADLVQLLDDLTRHFENDTDSPSLLQHIPDDYISRMVKAIVAFELKIESIEHVFKLSQNRDAESFDHIIYQLEQRDPGAQYIAAEMRKIRTGLYP